jgi:ComF family protein
MWRKIFAYTKEYLDSFKQLFYPHICLGCGLDTIDKEHILCGECIKLLPTTGFFEIPQNEVEKIFWGRVPFHRAASLLFFTKESLVQKIIIGLKYDQDKTAGFHLGELMGIAIQKSAQYQCIDYLVPIPITKQKNKKRTYNQSLLICIGIQKILPQINIVDCMRKNKATPTQTLQDRVQRENIRDNIFELDTQSQIKGKHILVIDDIITTGATLEAAYLCLVAAKPASISFATAAYTI